MAKRTSACFFEKKKLGKKNKHIVFLEKKKVGKKTSACFFEKKELGKKKAINDFI